MERERKSPEKQYVEISANITSLENWANQPTLSLTHEDEQAWEAERMQILMTLGISNTMIDRLGVGDQDDLKTRIKTLKEKVESLTLPPVE